MQSEYRELRARVQAKKAKIEQEKAKIEKEKAELQRQSKEKIEKEKAEYRELQRQSKALRETIAAQRTMKSLERKSKKERRRGIERYFQYDLSNPIDAEIVRRIHTLTAKRWPRGQNYGHAERTCRCILGHRLGFGRISNNPTMDERIENRLLRRCEQNGKTRNDYVRELFCIQFNIKGYEVCRDP